jgi:hypothetical protein
VRVHSYSTLCKLHCCVSLDGSRECGSLRAYIAYGVSALRASPTSAVRSSCMQTTRTARTTICIHKVVSLDTEAATMCYPDLSLITKQSCTALLLLLQITRRSTHYEGIYVAAQLLISNQKLPAIHNCLSSERCTALRLGDALMHIAYYSKLARSRALQYST